MPRLAALVARAERRILARIDRLLQAVGVTEPAPAPPVRTAPPLGDLAGLRAEPRRVPGDEARGR